MKSLVLQPTDMAQWHALVSEAQVACKLNLGEHLESYLVFLLMRFVDRPEMTRKIMALEFLNAQQSAGNNAETLRDVGDQCLLFSGLFPQIAAKRLVRVSYFVNIGRSAYQQASLADQTDASLFSRLAEAFVCAMDVLLAMRGLSGQPALQPLAAAELWQDTGSRSAFEELASCSDATPVRSTGSKYRH